MIFVALLVALHYPGGTARLHCTITNVEQQAVRGGGGGGRVKEQGNRNKDDWTTTPKTRIRCLDLMDPVG